MSGWPAALALVVGAVALGSGAAAAAARPARVRRRERLGAVDPRLIAALDAWDEKGTFAVDVAPDGGLRSGPEAEARQAEYFRTGASKARTLAQTPHGRGGAVDLWPEGFSPAVGLSRQPDVVAKWMQLGAFMEARGLTWGRAFQGFTAPDGVKGDWPHFELPDWQQLPYPPRTP